MWFWLIFYLAGFMARDAYPKHHPFDQGVSFLAWVHGGGPGSIPGSVGSFEDCQEHPLSTKLGATPKHYQVCPPQVSQKSHVTLVNATLMK